MAQAKSHSSKPWSTSRKILPTSLASAPFRGLSPRNSSWMRSSHSVDLKRHVTSPLKAINLDSKQTVNPRSAPRLSPSTPATFSRRLVDSSRIFHNSNIRKCDPLTGIGVNSTDAFNSIHDTNESSHLINSETDRLILRERQLPSPSSTTSFKNVTPLNYQKPRHQITDHVETEEVNTTPTANDDEGLPVVSVDKSLIPVYSRFPFDVTFLPQPMDANVEDDVHKLRLRLIESELEHQRRSTADYIKRTQEQFSLSSPKPTERNIGDISSSNDLMYRRMKTKILSRQSSYSPLPIRSPVPIGNLTSLSRDRIGLEGDPQDNLDIERDLEIRQIQESLQGHRQLNHPLKISDYSYDHRLHLQPQNSVLDGRQYSSSNMDDLIDSMARRHLAVRRLDAAVDRQRRTLGGLNSYLSPSTIRRQPSYRSQTRGSDIFLTNPASPSHSEQDYVPVHSHGFNPMVRSRTDYYSGIQPAIHDYNSNLIIRTNSYTKLPPITPGIDSSRYSRAQNLSNLPLYPVQQILSGQRNQSHSIPSTLPVYTEHLIELPSDIFLSSRTDPLGSSQRHLQNPTIKPEPLVKERSFVSVDSDTEQSVGESRTPIVNHYQKPKSRKQSPTGQHGFFTEGNPSDQQPRNQKFRRYLFQKAAIGILFIIVLKRRAAKSRLNRPSQSYSATIHKIRLQEIMVALHRVYLEPDGPIYNALIQAVSSPVELKDALNPSTTNYAEAVSVIGQVLKDVISKIVDFMPKDGILGTSSTSAVSALIQDGNPFPSNYFWECEKDVLEFHKSKIINVTKQRAILLLMGAFIFRALVTTLLIKPIKYRFLLGELTPSQSASLKVLASVILYVARRTVKSIPQILPQPREWDRFIYSDHDIEPIIENQEIKSIITTCELSLRAWCEEYIRRIDTSLGKELRT